MRHNNHNGKSFVFFLAVCLFMHSTCLLGQCPEVDAGDDQVECSIPGSFTLEGDVDGDYISVEWTPDDGLSDPFDINTEVTLSECMTYTLTARVIDYDNNLVSNGDFEGGNSDFYTDYIYHEDPTIGGDQLIEGEYTVDTDPSIMHNNWVACGDQTSGSGNMLVANGSESAGQSVWCQDIAIDPNTEYVFSAWIASVDPNGPAELQFSIDGSDIGGGSVVISTPCSWFQYFEFWDSGGSSSITICIEDLNTDEPGNDFAIDDIVFAPVCNSQDTVRLCVSEVEAELEYNGPICEGETLSLVANGGDYYEWEGPSFSIDIDDCCYMLDDAEADFSGFYGVTAIDEFGCSDFEEIEVIIEESYEETIVGTTCDPSLEGDSVEMLETENGCDSIVYLTLVYSAPTNDTIYNTSCNIAEAGVNTEMLTNQFGCDSILTLITDYIPGDTINITEATCVQAEAGMFIQSFTNSFGCDSTVMLNVVYQDIIQEEVFTTTCDLANEGVFVENLMTAIGCDSMVTTYVDYITPTLTELELFTCDSLAVGITTDTLLNVSGCDSIVRSDIKFVASDFITFSEMTCDQSQVGVAVQMLINENGCDSIVETTTIFVPSDFVLITLETCDPAQAGSFTENYVNQNGCDSIVQVDVALIDSYMISVIEETCDIDQLGSFTQMLVSVFGCDSIVDTQVVLVDSDFMSFVEETCDQEEVGVITEMLINENGCDSIVETEFILLDSDLISFMEETCDPDEAGIQVEMLINENGCDSIVETETILLASDFIELELMQCGQGEAETIVEMLTNGVGCDSIVSTTIFYLMGDTIYQLIETCDSLDVGLFMESYINQFGCDSTVVNDVVLVGNLEVALQISQPDCFEENQGAIQVNVEGGVEPIQYSINNSMFGTDPLFENLSGGSYEIIVQDASGCMISEMIQIDQVNPIEVSLGDDISIEFGQTAFLEAIINISADSVASIQWISSDSLACDTCLTQNVVPLLTTTYAIEVVDEIGCIDRDEMQVIVSLAQDIYVPNIFSTAQNSANNVFMIFAKEGLVKNIDSFQGFDRWGNRIWQYNDFLPNDAMYSWDGKFKGQDVNAAVFVWWAQVEFFNGEVLTISGDVTLVD